MHFIFVLFATSWNRAREEYILELINLMGCMLMRFHKMSLKISSVGPCPTPPAFGRLRTPCWVLCSMSDVTLVIGCDHYHFEGGLRPPSFLIELLVGCCVRCPTLAFNRTPCWVLCSIFDVTLVFGCDHCHFEGGLRPP